MPENFSPADVVGKKVLTLDQDIIASFSAAGFAIFPLGVGEDSKRPLPGFREWEKVPVDPTLTTQIFKARYPDNNYGIVVGKNHLVIDVDVKKGDGLASFRKLTQELELPHGWESQTLVVKTGSGGYHIYFLKPPETKIKKNHPDLPHIDFLSGNMYTVGPGSIHPDTNQPYRVVFGSPKSIAPAPAALLARLRPGETVAPEVEENFIDNNPLNIERFLELLEALPVCTEGGRGNACYVTACRAREFGLSADCCDTILQAHYNGSKLIPPLEKEEVSTIVLNAYRYAQNRPGTANAGAIFKTVEAPVADAEEELILDKGKDGMTALKTLHNLVVYILTFPDLKDAFRYNEFSGMIELNAVVPWYTQRHVHSLTVEDNDIVQLKYYLARQVGIEFPVNMIWEAVIIVGYRKHYHPVQNYLNSLIWDGVPRLDTWLSYYCNAADTPYTRDIGRKTLCAAVKRIFNPGCKWDYVLVLEGEQGQGKSGVCQILGRLWYADVLIDPHNKDTVSAMSGKWVIELSEMASLKWAESNALKAFITREKDVVRLPYKRASRDFPRQCIFIGTVNNDHAGYLSDYTGNRRYWIVEVFKEFKFREFENDCNQLWAEAMVRYKSEPLMLTGESAEAQAAMAVQRMPDNFAGKHVSQWLSEHPEQDSVFLHDLLLYCGMNPTRTFKGDVGKVTDAMASAGWFRRRVRENGVYVTIFERPKKV